MITRSRAGRRPKRVTVRNRRLTIRITEQHLDLLNRMVGDSGNSIISQADIVAFALERYASQDYNMYVDYTQVLRIKTPT